MTESYALHTAPIAPSPMSSCSSNFPTRRYCSVCGIVRYPPELTNVRIPLSGSNRLSTTSAHDPVVNPPQQGPGGRVHNHVAPGEDALGGFEEPVAAHAGAARATPGEGWDVLGRSHVLEHVCTGADHGPRAEQRADRRLGMIADQAPQKLQTGLEARSRDVESPPTVRVLQVRRDRPRAEVGPAADHAVADEAVVRLVRVSQEHTARQLTARVGARTDRRGAHGA